MYAVSIDANFHDLQAAKGELGLLVEHVSGMPGFAAGYWVEVTPGAVEVGEVMAHA
jgi:hypothetical protein